MSLLIAMDWHAMWIPGESLLEIVLRGSFMYVGLVVLFRLLRRDTGSLSLADVLLVVLISDAAQNGMSGEYRSITAGFVLVGTIAGWSYFFDWLSFRYPVIEHLLQPRPLPLIKNGVLLLRNLRQQLITPDELKSQLRQKGVARLEEIRVCYIEPDGQISVVKSSKPRTRRSGTSTTPGR